MQEYSSKSKILPIALGLLLLLSGCQPGGLDNTASLHPASPATIKIPTLPARTPTRSPSPTLSPTPVLNPGALLSSKPSQTPASVPAFSEEHYIENITGHKQYFPLGCEAAAAVDWAAYFGVPINEYEFQVRLPQSDNPDFGFVGGVQGPWGQTPPYSYGVHAGPIAALLREYGLPAIGLRNTTLEVLKSHISMDKPVIAWVIGNVVGGVPAEYTDKQGNKVTVAAYEHVVILTGYDADSIRYMNNGRFYEAPEEVFLNSWGVLNNMVVIMDN
ncbi:MAG: C39 family peptidase [Anaerolineaceae bacterium]|nr:C39 family peptidase [Anaerolineaceae bacterium]